MFLFNALKFVDHVPSRLKCCNDNASMKNLNSLFFMSCVDVINENRQTSETNYAPLGGRLSPPPPPPTQCTAFLRTQQTRQNDVATPLFSLFVLKKCEEYFVAFLFFTKC